MRKKGWDKGLIVMLISTLITIAVWVGVEVYRAYIRVNIPEGVEKHLNGIDTTLDVTIFDKLRERGTIDET